MNDAQSIAFIRISDHLYISLKSLLWSVLNGIDVYFGPEQQGNELDLDGLFYERSIS